MIFFRLKMKFFWKFFCTKSALLITCALNTTFIGIKDTSSAKGNKVTLSFN